MMAEHGINSDGTITCDQSNHDLDAMFDCNDDGTYVPRTIFSDLDQITIEEAMKSEVGQLMSQNQFVSSTSESGGIFTRAKHIAEAKIINDFMNAFEREVNKCTLIEWICIFHSTSGGAGTSLTSLYLDKLATFDRKITRINFILLPSKSI